MAHGELMMLGAYTTFVIQELDPATHAPDLFGYSLFIAVPAAFLVAGAVGVAIERGIVRFLYGRPLETLLATWGVSLILQQAVRTIFGPNNQEVGTPAWMSGAFQFGETARSPGTASTSSSSASASSAALLALLKRTPLGLQIARRHPEPPMASEMGIRTARSTP